MKTFKDSSIKYLGKIPKHWKVKRLVNFGIFLKGGNISRQDLIENGESAILYGDIYMKYEISARFLDSKISKNTSLNAIPIYKGDILFAGSGETKEDIGKNIVYLGDEIAFAGGDVIIFRQKENNALFLSYALNTKYAKFYKSIESKGEIIVHIYASNLRGLKIPLPPLKEQKEIAEFLDKKCEKISNFIDKKQKLITLLEEKKQALINEVVTKGLDSKTELKDSGIKYLGKIPKHWEVRKIKHICNINPQTNTKLPNRFVYIDLESVKSGYLFKKQIINRDNAPSRAQRILQKQDILFQLVRPYQKNNYLFDKSGDYVASTGYAQLRTSKNVKFIYYALLEDSLVQRVVLKSTGSNYPAITSSDFGDLKIPLPPLKEQEQIAEFLDSKIAKIDTIIEKTKKQIELIKEYKTTLISQAVCGRIMV
ncbi:restriction endonuclease subunit S [Helicobacter sp. MIT 11-5569]|uniref:restriction endonuclease subunit S n=1 Tax=Helicobacter sp. MIT 11-5569 TaxID=1548151 RepID=UPI0013761CBC|nr:restriction endonuclease subunit S [Helicobacter sp. MIT 11-5569]